MKLTEKEKEIYKDRILKNIVINKESGCWEWNGAGRGNGYGCIRIKKQIIDCHRISYIIFKGDIPNKLLVCHTCDNRKCCNPEHLWIGTYKDNMMDCSLKGRISKKKTSLGIDSPRRKFSREQIIEIKIMLSNGVRQIDIAKKFNCDRRNINDIKRRKSYING